MKQLLLFTYWSLAFSLFSQSPYITRVFEYTPAPGQFINELPEYEDGDNAEAMAAKAEAAIANNNRGMISLGGYGGYVVLGFDHTIVNLPDSCDFKVLGNAFWSASNPNTDASKRGGSSEPGIIMVSVDLNQNGLPDDEWYEIAGSEYHSEETIKHYEITYYKPNENKIPTPDKDYAFLTDTTYVRWTTNGHGNGYVYKNSFHSQTYWPQWLEGDQLTIQGTKLADNYIDESGNGSYYVQYAYPWGYADNAPNTDSMSNIDIAWAVDKNGNPVSLAGIDFIKIYTGVNQYCGWLGETSTEISGVEDLHPEAVLPSTGQNLISAESQIRLMRNPVQAQLIIHSTQYQIINIYNISGQEISSAQIKPGINYIDCSSLPAGIYLLRGGKTNIRIIKE